MTDGLTISVPDPDRAATVRNALEAAADERDATLNDTRGRPGDGEIAQSEALAEVAAAYTGWKR